ncbi:CoA-binding protein [Variovorax sp. KK3]|uniref:succinate--CoA ligase subunit alpha n=1 Tax=Variovorax sp. KK3 TaxID=1855728 RepID=UPI00097BE1E0|nr:CoA-binding protein [Variovorax sp. KK3]
MAILLNSETRVLAVNATGAYGGGQVRAMRGFGTQVVAHVAPGRRGEIDGLPVFDTIAAAVQATQATAAAVFTPAAGVRDSIDEAARVGLKLVFAAAEFVPVHDVLRAAQRAREAGCWLVGPNSSGMASPGQAVLGAIPPGMTLPGRIGVIGRSGTLTMNVCRALSLAGLGQSSVVHIGGDVVCGRNPHEWLGLFAADAQTDLVVYLGEPGGTKEYAMLDAVREAGKPVVALVVGRHVPPARRMGHAGAMVGSARETAGAKIEALAGAGAHVAKSPAEVVEIAARLLRRPVQRAMESFA